MAPAKKLVAQIHLLSTGRGDESAAQRPAQLASHGVLVIPHIQIARISGHSFVAGLVNPDSVIIDLGLNAGEFACSVIHRFNCRVVGVEPVPALFDLLPKELRLTALQQAITSDGANVVLHLNSSRCATATPALAEDAAQTVVVAGTTLGDLIEHNNVQRAAVVKVDIEGAEIGMIETLTAATAARIDQLSVEFHDFVVAEHAGAVRDARRRLEALGFTSIRFSRDNTDVLFLNVLSCPLSPLTRMLILARYKYGRGLSRVIKRLSRRGDY